MAHLLLLLFTYLGLCLLETYETCFQGPEMHSFGASKAIYLGSEALKSFPRLPTSLIKSQSHIELPITPASCIPQPPPSLSRSPPCSALPCPCPRKSPHNSLTLHPLESPLLTHSKAVNHTGLSPRRHRRPTPRVRPRMVAPLLGRLVQQEPRRRAKRSAPTLPDSTPVRW